MVRRLAGRCPRCRSGRGGRGRPCRTWRARPSSRAWARVRAWPWARAEARRAGAASAVGWARGAGVACTAGAGAAGTGAVCTAGTARGVTSAAEGQFRRRIFAHQRIGPLIPFRTRIVAVEHGGGALRLDLHAEREIALDQPLQRLGRVGGRLVIVDDLAEAHGSRDPLAAALVEAADLHLLAGKVIVDQIDLEARVGGIARRGITANQLAQRVVRLQRDLLVARHVADLLIITERDEIISIRRVAIAG